MRKTARQLSAIIATAKAANAGVAILFSLASFGNDKSLKFNGTVAVGGVAYQVAADNGKIQNFADADSFIKKLSKFAETGDGVYPVTVSTGSMLASKVPTNIVAANAAKIVALGKTKTAQQAVVATLDDQIALMAGWDTGNAAQQAKLTEVQAEKTAVVGDIAAIDAEVAALSA